MSECEGYEVLISAQLDGELEGERLPDLLDHVAFCAHCRRFYLEARALVGVLEALPGRPPAEPLPDVLWQDLPASGRKKGGELWRWTLRVAASLLLAVGVAFAVVWLRPGTEASPPPVEIALGERPEAMTDELFVEITTRLLMGERRYRQTMLQVMREVEGPSTEGGGDALARVEEPTEEQGERPGELRV